MKKYLENMANHIQLMFPYIDYGINYKNSEKNKFLDFEQDYLVSSEYIQVGQIIPNLVDKISQIRLREIIRKMQKQSEYPLFILIKNSEEPLNELNIFKNPTPLSNFKSYILLNKELKGDIWIPELEMFNIILVRPDHIIEVVS